MEEIKTEPRVYITVEDQVTGKSSTISVVRKYIEKGRFDVVGVAIGKALSDIGFELKTNYLRSVIGRDSLRND